MEKMRDSAKPRGKLEAEWSEDEGAEQEMWEALEGEVARWKCVVHMRSVAA